MAIRREAKQRQSIMVGRHGNQERGEAAAVNHGGQA